MIFFDLDGTLLDDARATACGLDALCLELGDAIDTPRAELARRWQALYEEHFARFVRGELTVDAQRRARLRGLLCKDHECAANDDAADAIYAKYLAAYRGGWTRYDDVLPCLESLPGAPFGVISNGEQRQQCQKLEAVGLATFFRWVVTASDVGVSKPNARIFAEACRQAGVEPSRCVYVGDDWHVDVIGSRAFGLRPVWLRRPGTRGPHELDATVSVIESLSELAAVLTSIEE